ncbi:MAG: poly-gamma-glutamate hydrolase family protein [Halobacteriaceae archaeon]
MPPSTLRTHPLSATETGHHTELLYDDGDSDGTAVCAPHGGEVEPGTAEQALDLAVRLDATCWACLGYDEGEAFDCWHPPSTAFDPAEYPLLAEIADRGFDTVVSLHGLADGGVLVGGADGETKGLVARRLDAALDATVETVSTGEYAGASPENVVNRLAAGGGVQLEQGPSVRADARGTVVETLADLLQ